MLRFIRLSGRTLSAEFGHELASSLLIGQVADAVRTVQDGAGRKWAASIPVLVDPLELDRGKVSDGHGELARTTDRWIMPAASRMWAICYNLHNVNLYRPVRRDK
jgi:hypothetical protein